MRSQARGTARRGTPKQSDEIALRLRYSAAGGLCLDWGRWRNAAVRVDVRGHHVFYVWGQFAGNSGEEAPRWAEPDLALAFFGPHSQTEVACCDDTNRLRIVSANARSGAAYRAGRNAKAFRSIVGACGDNSATIDRFVVTGTTARGIARLAIRGDAKQLALRLAIECPSGSAPLPVCLAEIRIEGIPVSAGAVFHSAHAYGGRTFGRDLVRNIRAPGVCFTHGVIGLSMPLLYLHEPRRNGGVECEFLLDGRPTVWLRPANALRRLQWAAQWQPDRLLPPGQSHAFGGEVDERIRLFS